MNKTVILNSISGTILYGVNVISVFILSPVIIRILGNSNYGLWELVMSAIGYMGLLDLGIGPAMIRFVSVADGKQDRHELQQVMSTALVFFVLVGAIAFLALALLGQEPSLLLGPKAGDTAGVGTVLLLLGCNAALLFPLQVFITTLMGLQRHCFINFSRAGLLILRATVTYVLLKLYPHNGLLVLALVEPIFTACQFVIFATAVVRNRNIPPLSWSAPTLAKLKELFSFGAKSATMLVASRLQNQSVPFIISHIIGVSQIVYFIMPNRLVDYSKGISNAIGIPLAPYFGAAIGKGDDRDLLRSWLNSTFALQIISLAIPLGIFFCGETFLSLWLGPEYGKQGHWIIYLLVCGLFADSLAANSFRVLTAKSMHGVCATIWLLLSAVSIPVGIWCGSLWGLIGVTFGTTLVTIIGNLISMKLACSVMNVSIGVYLRSTFFPLMLPLFFLATTLLLMTHHFPVVNYAVLFVDSVVAIAVYLLALWHFSIPQETKTSITARMRPRFILP